MPNKNAQTKETLEAWSPTRENRRVREIHHPPRGRTPCVQETRVKVKDRHLPPVPKTSRDNGAPPNRRGKPNKKMLKPNNSHRKSQSIRLIWQIERFRKESNCLQSIQKQTSIFLHDWSDIFNDTDKLEDETASWRIWKNNRWSKSRVSRDGE